MAVYMPPLARKKRVENRYNPDTFRVISHYAEETHPKFETNEPYYPSLLRQNGGLSLPDIVNRKTEVLPKSAPDYRMHNPHPGSCGFLRSNVRLLNEPICCVYTASTHAEQNNWWPSRANKEPLHVPPKTMDTIYRVDFQKDAAQSSAGSQRHTANPNKEPALGTVPVNFLRPRNNKQRLFQEKFSFEHQYNSRLDKNYPIRGKRQGHFVWDEMNKETTNKFIERYAVISAEEGMARQQEEEFRKSLMKFEPTATQLPPDTSEPEPAVPEPAQLPCPSDEPKPEAAEAGVSSPKRSPNKTEEPSVQPKAIPGNPGTKPSLNTSAAPEMTEATTVQEGPLEAPEDSEGN